MGVEVSLAEGGVLGFGCLLEGGESDIALNKGAIGSEGEVVLLEDREFGGGEAWFGVLGDAAGHFVAFVVLSVEGPCALCVAFEPDGMDMCAAFSYCAKNEVQFQVVRLLRRRRCSAKVGRPRFRVVTTPKLSRMLMTIRCGDARFVLSGGVIGDDGVGLSCCVIVCARGDRECEG